MAMRIAVDAMGGDRAPEAVVEGAVRAARRAEGALELLLVGPHDRVQAALDAHEEAAALPLRILEAPEVIGMDEAPAAAVKRKPRSSIHVGLGAHKKGAADAFVSAGNTGAVMAASLFILKRAPGVERPSVIGYFPTVEGPCVVLDVGTNVDCRPEHFVQFARMGAIYAEQVMQRETASVALLNIGEEPGKGNEQVKAAYELLAACPDLNFRGNIEGRDLLCRPADVVVCDGFVGNILLKMGEALGTTLLAHLVRREVQRQQLSAAEQALVLRVVEGIQEPFDYEARGGVPLLGVDGSVIIGHGRSSARAFERMIFAAREVARQDVAGAIAAAFD